MKYVEIETSADETRVFPLLHQLRPDLTEQEYLARLKAARSESQYKLLALEVDGQSVALMGYRVLTDFVHGRHLYIDDLVVDQSHRSKGYGKEMLLQAKKIAKENLCKRLRLCTGNQNSDGMAFYEKVGWSLKAVVFKALAD